jgi:hypothetical protein
MKPARYKCFAIANGVVAVAATVVGLAFAQELNRNFPPLVSGPVGYGQYVGADPAPTPLPPVTEEGYGAARAFATSDGRTPAKLASYPRSFTEPLLDEPDNFVLVPEAQQPQTPPRRAGFFQRIAGVTTYLPRFGDDGAGFWDTEVYAVFAVPFPTLDMPLLIEPGTDFWVVDAPAYDLPPTLHDDYLELHWLAKFNEQWAADVKVAPGWHSDYQNSNSSQAFRVESHAVGAYSWTPNLKVAFGVAYWDRLNVKFIPAGGIIYTPNEYTRYEIITPKPRIAFRYDQTRCWERWLYIAGEFGGGEWAIQQSSGADNILNYSDYRVMLGLEHKSLNLGLNGRAEIGYVFGRQFQYATNIADQDVPSTMMARLGLSY